jgi:hypothetical protein
MEGAMNRKAMLIQAIRVSWQIFSLGGLWLLGVIGLMIAYAIIGLVYKQWMSLEVMLYSALAGALLFAFWAGIPIWMTLLSFCFPRRTV